MTIVPKNRSKVAREEQANAISGQPGRAFAWGAWKERAACANKPVVKLETEAGQMIDHVLIVQDFYFDEETHGPGYGRGMSRVKKLHLDMLRRVCKTCPVKMQCRELAKVEEWGFLAGESESERRKNHRHSPGATPPLS